MSENSGGAGAPQGGSEAGGEGAGAPNQTTNANGEQGGDQKPQSTSANQLIKSFAAERGMTVEALINQFKTLEDQGKTELERLAGERDSHKTRAEQALSKLRDANGRVALQGAISALPNVYDPTTLVDVGVSLLEFDDDGNATNVDAAIKQLRTRYPKQFPAAAGSGDGGARGETGTTGDFNSAIREMARGVPR